MGGTASKATHGHVASNLEKRLVSALAGKHGTPGRAPKSFNSILLKFPKIDAAFQTVRAAFQMYDTDHSGTIDLQEMRASFKDLKVDVTDKEVEEFFKECDMDASKNISFKEFIITLAFVHLLAPPSQPGVKSRIGMPQLEATLDTIVDAFIYFDRDHDGYVGKDEIESVLSESTPGGVSSSLGLKRFEEMDWDKDGKVTFKEFLFAFADWVGVEDDEDDD